MSLRHSRTETAALLALVGLVAGAGAALAGYLLVELLGYTLTPFDRTLPRTFRVAVITVAILGVVPAALNAILRSRKHQ